MKERIIEFLRKENKSAAHLAEEIGVQPSGISHILSGRNKPSLDFVIKMLERYPYIRTDWLLFGKGAMYMEQSMQDLFTDQADIKDNRPSPSGPDDKLSEPVIKEDHLREPEADAKVRNLAVERIVWFYSNNSFREYIPDNE